MRTKQDELEAGAVRMRALVDELAAVSLGVGLRDREPEAAIVAGRLVATAEPVEEARHELTQRPSRTAFASPVFPAVRSPTSCRIVAAGGVVPDASVSSPERMSTSLRRASPATCPLSGGSNLVRLPG